MRLQWGVLAALVLLAGCQTTSPATSGSATEQLARDRDSLLATKGQLESRISTLERDLVSQESSLELLQAQVQALKQEKADLVDRKTASKDELQSRLSKVLEEKESLDRVIAQLEMEKKNLTRQLQEESARLAASAAQLRNALKVEIERGEVEVVQYQNVLLVNIKDSLLFAPDSPVLKDGYLNTLNTVAKAFQEFPDKVIRVEGHTAVASSRWSSSWDLGSARAVNVVRYLQDNLGIDPSRLVALSFGEYRPLANNATESGRASNRRVELVLVDRPLYQVQELIASSR